jgi:hypothetical protein
MSMSRRSRPRARKCLSGAAALTLGLGLAAAWSPAVAQAQASSTRDVIINDLQTEHTVNDCTGDLGTFSRHFTGSAHTVTRPDGSVHFNALIRADDATFVPDDPTLPVFSGKELVHVSDTTNGSNATFTFMVRVWATAPDGSNASVKELEHMTVSANGNVVAFDKPVLICP